MSGSTTIRSAWPHHPDEKIMNEYRCYTVGPDGNFRSCEIVKAAGDDDAVTAAKRLAVDCSVEVWLLDRKVAILPPENSGS
jgi:hypothetical protein